MEQLERPTREHEPGAERALRQVPNYQATWRYIGDRTAADQAYCARFGVDVAPEATIALGGAWAYPLPQ